MLAQVLIEINFVKLAPLTLRNLGRNHHDELIPIIPFPLQRHIRKAHLSLDIRNGSVPTLTIAMTGSGIRLPLALWKRPVEFDLVRQGLLSHSDLPKSVALQSAASSPRRR